MTQPSTSSPRPASLREWLNHLQSTGRLAIARTNVPLKHHLAAITKKLDGKKAVYFPSPDGHAVPVVSGFMSRREWIAEAMGVPGTELLKIFRQSVESPTPWVEINKEDAPCQEVILTEINLHQQLPIPTHSEHDNGPYLTAGLLITRNPKTGVQNVSIHRIQVHAKDRMAILMLPRHAMAFYRMAEADNQALPVAIAIGVDPLTMLASQAITPIDHDELEIAGSLHGQALKVVKCVSNDLRVPSNAEIIIEGHIPPTIRELEGPFGEFPKYYSSREAREIINVDLITHRKSPIFHTIVPAEMEHLLLGSIPREASFLGYLQRSFPTVEDVHLSMGGVGRYHLFIKFRKQREGEAKNLILCAFGAHYDIKHVVVVDTDVDVHDPQQIEWAIATRFQADKDLVLISGAQGSVLDPSTTVNNSSSDGGAIPIHAQGISAKMGLDATKPISYKDHTFTKVRIPGEDTLNLEDEIQSCGYVNFDDAATK